MFYAVILTLSEAEGEAPPHWYLPLQLLVLPPYVRTIPAPDFCIPAE
jgi:hypothetical protein